MYYAARGSFVVDEIGELNGTLFGQLPTGASYGPTNTFYDPSNHLLYVEDGGWLYLGYGNQVVVLNTTTGRAIANLTVGGFPSTFAYDSAKHLIYVSCAATGTISEINDLTNQVVGTISLGPTTLPGAILVDPTTGDLLVGEDGTGMLVELATGAPTSNATGYWSPVVTAGAPTGRAGAGVAYDAASGSVVLFGGCTSGSFFDQQCNASRETWTYSGGAWTQIPTAVSPSARVLPSMAYDPGTQDVLLFGGLTGYPNGTPLRDTWEFNGTAWTELSPATSPPASGMNQAMTYDPATGSVVLFASGWQAGVLGPPTGYLNQTWAFSNGRWMEIANGTGPSPRGLESLTYDASSHALVLFGGSQCGYFDGSWPCPTLGDTWTFANGSWTRQSPSTSPTPRNLAALAYDPQVNGSVLVGGQSGLAVYSDEWAYVNGTWNLIESPLAPAPRVGAQMAYDAAEGAIVLFGGYLHVGRPTAGAELYYNDTWTLRFGQPPSRLSVVALLHSKGPSPVGSIVILVADVRSATSVSYSFTGLPPGCNPLDMSLLACAPTVAGEFRIVLTVTDAYGMSSNGSVVLVVTGTSSVSTPSPSAGTTVTLVMVVSGVAGLAIGVIAVAAVAYVRGRERLRERQEGEAIVRELEDSTRPDRPMP